MPRYDPDYYYNDHLQQRVNMFTDTVEIWDGREWKKKRY